MAHLLKMVKVPPNSASLDEARKRTFEFFKTACRSIPTVMDIYNLKDVVTESHLRSSISSQIRKNAHVKDTKVIDMLLFKATEELSNIVTHSKQRHHVIGQYVVGPEGLIKEEAKEKGSSDFLNKFYSSNYF